MLPREYSMFQIRAPSFEGKSISRCHPRTGANRYKLSVACLFVSSESCLAMHLLEQPSLFLGKESGYFFAHIL